MTKGRVQPTLSGMPRNLSILGVLAATGALLVPATASAASTTTITACLNPKTGALTIKSKCKKGQKKLQLQLAGGTLPTLA